MSRALGGKRPRGPNYGEANHMRTRSLKNKLYWLTAFIAMLLIIVGMNYYFDRIEASANFQLQKVIELKKDLFEIILAENASLRGRMENKTLGDKYEHLQKSGAACHGKFSDDSLIRRAALFNELFRLDQKSSRLHDEVRETLRDLTGSVRYIHQHHIVYFKNLIRRGVVRQDYDEGEGFERSPVKSASEIDIITAAIAVQNNLKDIVENFHDLTRGRPLSDVKEKFLERITAFYSSVNSFEDYSLDAQDGILVEELLIQGRNIEKSFTDIVTIERNKTRLHKELEKNTDQLLTAFGFVYNEIWIRNKTTRRRIEILMAAAYIFMLLLVWRIMIDGKRIIKETNRTVSETRMIQRDLSYQIQTDARSFDEFRFLFRALNSMADKINSNMRALIENEERFAMAVKGGGVGVWDWDLEKDVIYVSPGFKEMLGFKEHEIGNRIEDVVAQIHPDDKKKVIEAAQVYLKGESERYQVEHRILHKDGSVRWFLMSGEVDRDADGKPVRFIGADTDVTDRKLVADALNESENRYKRFFEDDLSGAFVTSPDGRLLSANPAFARMFGFKSVEEMKNFEIKSIYPDSAPRDEFLARLKREKRVERYEQVMRRVDGSLIHTIENTSGVFDERGELTEIRGYLIDITTRRKLENKLRHTQKLESIGTLTSGVAHNFKNILAGISMDGQLIQMLYAKDEMLQKISRRTMASIKRGTQIVQELMKFSRKEPEALQVVNLAQVIRETHRLIRTSFDKIIDIRMDVPGMLAIMGNNAGLNQVFMNICNNARDAMPGGGSLRIKAWKEGEEALVAISDTGSGMDGKTRERCFDPFFTTKEIGRGTGLGLSTTYGIVKDHGGSIHLDSRLNEGATFRLHFPLALSGEVEALEETPPITPGRGEKILIIDDEIEMLASIILLLENSGFQVITANDCESGFARCKSERPDVVLLDRNMPKMNGEACAKKMIAHDPGANILIISGYDQNGPDGIDDATKSIIKDYISKPIEIGELSRVLARLLHGE